MRLVKDCFYFLLRSFLYVPLTNFLKFLLIHAQFYHHLYPYLRVHPRLHFHVRGFFIEKISKILLLSSTEGNGAGWFGLGWVELGSGSVSTAAYCASRFLPALQKLCSLYQL